MYAATKAPSSVRQLASRSTAAQCMLSIVPESSTAHHQARPLPSCQQRPCQQTGICSRNVASFSSPRFVVACATASMEGNVVELEVKIEGMKCGGCSSRVEEALKAMDSVKAVQVDLETKLATVEVEAESLIDAMNMLPTFVSTIKELGFEAEPHIEYQL